MIDMRLQHECASYMQCSVCACLVALSRRASAPLALDTGFSYSGGNKATVELGGSVKSGWILAINALPTLQCAQLSQRKRGIAGWVRG